MRKIAKLAAFLAIALCGCAVRPPAAKAQYIGTTSPQSNFGVIANNVLCTGSPQLFPVQNLGQTQHQVLVSSVDLFTQLTIEIDGIDAAGNTVRISDVGQNGQGTLETGTGAYNVVEANITCSPNTAHFTLTYFGVSSTPPATSGVALTTSIDKRIFIGATGVANQTAEFPTPFGSSSGQFRISHGTNGSANVTIDCFNSTNTQGTKFFIFPLLTTAATEFFTVPPSTCPSLAVSYFQSGGAGTITLEYFFDPPGLIPNQTLGSYSHITGTTATPVKSSTGTLLAVNLNTSAAGTVSVFDLPAASCTATPSTNTVAVLTIAATEIARSIPFNAQLLTGICVKASAAMDLTIEYQ